MTFFPKCAIQKVKVLCFLVVVLTTGAYLDLNMQPLFAEDDEEARALAEELFQSNKAFILKYSCYDYFDKKYPSHDDPMNLSSFYNDH